MENKYELHHKSFLYNEDWNATISPKLAWTFVIVKQNSFEKCNEI
jgi:hypothetical protein